MRERFQSDERGVSEVVGAILVFALLVMLLAITQAQAVPNHNQEVEYKHSLQVQSDLIQFHQIASSVAADGSDRSTSFNMGTGYPSRMLFFNPPRVQGQLATSDPATVAISNIEASNGEVDDYITDDQASAIDLDTRRLEYHVNYNEIHNDPTTRYEYGLLYNQFDDGRVIENEGNIIDGTNINLLFMAGDYAESSTTEESLDVQSVSAPARSVTITSPNTNPIVLELPTALPASEWDDLYNTPSNNIQGVSQGSNPDTVEIELDPSKSYNLRMAEIGLESGVQRNDPHYIVPADPAVTSAGVGQTAVVEYEVRDEFNNPVIDADVAVPDNNGGFITKTTDDQGRVSAPVSTNRNTGFTAFLVDGNSQCPTTPDPSNPSHCQADYRVQVPGLNLNPSSGVVVDDATTADVLNLGSTLPLLTSSVATVTLNATNGSAVGIDLIRMNHYSPDPNSHGPATVSDGSTNFELVIGGGFKSPPSNFSEVQPGGTQYGFGFEDTVDSGDYFVLTIIFDNNERALYFISPS